MKNITINEKEYELIKNVRDGFSLEDFQNKLTDYFDDYDYICGDWAYGKLRLKGFCDKNNKKFTQINDYSKLEKYLLENCARNCRHFVVKKIK